MRKMRFFICGVCMTEFSSGCDLTSGSLSPDADGATLAALVRGSDKDAFSALLSKYDALISATATRFSCSECDRDDLMQEGYIALYAAANTYEDCKGASFDTYASVCIRHRMQNFVEKARRNAKLTVSLEERDNIGDSCDPQSLFEEKIDLKRLFGSIEGQLSSLEKKVFSLYASGLKVREIAQELGASSKSVENAMARIRRKFRK